MDKPPHPLPAVSPHLIDAGQQTFRWLPPFTAPKCGSVVVVCPNPKLGAILPVVAYYHDGKWWQVTNDDEGDVALNFTPVGWFPIPLAPSE